MAARVIDGIAGLREIAGQEAGTSGWIEVTQDMIDRFADLTGDRQWIHVDVERARRESPFGATVAHGFLTTSLMSRLVHEAVTVHGNFKLTVNYGFNRVRFPAPVPAGSSIRARVAVNSVRDIEGGLEIAWGITVEIEGRDKPAVAAESADASDLSANLSARWETGDAELLKFGEPCEMAIPSQARLKLAGKV